MRTNTLLPRLAEGAAVLAVVGATLLINKGASAQTPPPGAIAFTQTVGTHDTIVTGMTAGPCDIGESNAYQVFVTGPDRFAPRPGQEDGVTFRGPTMAGFSKTAPNEFEGRLSSQQLAQEEGLSAVPVGVYTIDFRCIDELFRTVFQTYRSTITFTTPMRSSWSWSPSAW